MRAAGYEFRDLGIVVDIGKAKAHLAIGDHIEQIEPALPWNVTWLDQSRNRGRPALGIGTHAFLLLRGESAVGISRREAPVPERGIVARGLGHRGV